MIFQRRLWGAFFLGLIFLGVVGGAVFAAQRTVKLKSGAEVTGEILKDSGGRVVVDLGGVVVTLPREDVERIVERGEVPAVEQVSDFFRVSRGGPSRSVQEHVLQQGEAVVQIRTPTGLGSGFVIHKDGYIVTNDHVVAGEHRITVTLYERAGEHRQYNNVRIVALEPRLDLALLKIEDAEGRVFSTVTLGDSEELQGGETVFAIGSPLGLERTVSQGIVSLKNRSLDGLLYIQTTTQINPGNSGGPLFNLRGEVIGVNNMKAMMVGVEGLNFAIPARTLMTFLVNRDAYAFDPRHPNAGFRYLEPPRPVNSSRSSPQK